MATKRSRRSVNFLPVVEVVDHSMDVSFSSLDPSEHLRAWDNSNNNNNNNFDAELGLGGNSSNHSRGSLLRVVEGNGAGSDGSDDMEDDMDLLVDTSMADGGSSERM